MMRMAVYARMCVYVCIHARYGVKRPSEIICQFTLTRETRATRTANQGIEGWNLYESGSQSLCNVKNTASWKQAQITKKPNSCVLAALSKCGYLPVANFRWCLFFLWVLIWINLNLCYIRSKQPLNKALPIYLLRYFFLEEQVMEMMGFQFTVFFRYFFGGRKFNLIPDHRAWRPV